MVRPRKVATPNSLIGRLLLILGAVVGSGTPLTLSELSRRTELPLTTTYRILTQMSDLGALVRTEDRKYRPGPRLAEWAVLGHGRDLASTAGARLETSAR